MTSVEFASNLRAALSDAPDPGLGRRWEVTRQGCCMLRERDRILGWLEPAEAGWNVFAEQRFGFLGLRWRAVDCTSHDPRVAMQAILDALGAES